MFGMSTPLATPTTTTPRPLIEAVRIVPEGSYTTYAQHMDTEALTQGAESLAARQNNNSMM